MDVLAIRKDTSRPESDGLNCGDLLDIALRRLRAAYHGLRMHAQQLVTAALPNGLKLAG